MQKYLCTKMQRYQNAKIPLCQNATISNFKPQTRNVKIGAPASFYNKKKQTEHLQSSGGGGRLFSKLHNKNYSGQAFIAVFTIFIIQLLWCFAFLIIHGLRCSHFLFAFPL